MNQGINQDESRNQSRWIKESQITKPQNQLNQSLTNGNSSSELQEDLVPARGSTVASRSEPWDTRWGVSRHGGTHVVVSE